MNIGDSRRNNIAVEYTESNAAEHQAFSIKSFTAH